MTKLNTQLTKGILTIEEQSRFIHLKEEIAQSYINITKEAFIGSKDKWLEDGENNSSYLFAL